MSDHAAMQSLLDDVEAAPHAYDFFALLRRIECLHPELPRWGEAMRPAQEPIRLGQEPEVDFAPAALAVLDRPGFGAPPLSKPRLGVRFFGLLGPQGPMPLHFTEYARERARQRGDPTLARFLDLFHHRMLALFYRAWAQCQPTVQHDRPHDDRFAAWLGASFDHARPRAASLRHDDRARLFHAGTLASRSRHPEGLAKLLTSQFGVPVRIDAHVAHWMTIAIDERSRLGIARGRPQRTGVAAQLGATATAGRRVRDRQFRFHVVLGPMSLAQYIAFLPGEPDWQRLCDWVRQIVGLDLLWDAQLCLARGQIPEPRPMNRIRLGITTWLGHAGRRPHERDRADLRLRQDSRSFSTSLSTSQTTAQTTLHGAHHG